MRTRALPRVITRLCLAALVVNLFAPIAWATLLPPPAPEAALCLSADDGAPGHHQAPHSGQPEHGAPHCPLCVLFGGTAWAPPADAIALALVVPVREPAPVLLTPAAPALPRALRPTPRAPPASI
jgi:hypothetical protein